MRRHALGLFSILFLLGGGAIWSFIGLAENTWQTAASTCLRVGLLLGAGWLAYDQVGQVLKKTPPWLAGTLALAVLIAIIRPRAMLYLLPLLAGLALLQFIGWLFKPLPKNVPRRGPARRTPPDQEA